MAKRKKERHSVEVSVAAFSDIAFLLIIFFILATTLVRITGMVTEIPSGEKAESKEEKEPPTVKLEGERILYNDENVDMKELRRRLVALNLAPKKDDGKVVLLEAGRNVRYQNYFDVMASISEAGGVTAILQEEE